MALGLKAGQTAEGRTEDNAFARADQSDNGRARTAMREEESLSAISSSKDNYVAEPCGRTFSVTMAASTV